MFAYIGLLIYVTVEFLWWTLVAIVWFIVAASRLAIWVVERVLRHNESWTWSEGHR